MFKYKWEDNIQTEVTVFWDVARCSVLEIDWHFGGVIASLNRAIMMEAVTTRPYIPEGSHLYNCRCENMKSYHVITNFTELGY
jgi:hypothetical protein